MILIGKQTLFQSNFPKSRGGLLSNVYYTVYNASGSVYLSRRQNNLVELGQGSYGLVLTFSAEGNYSIWWDINNSPYIASEEINVVDFTQQNLYSGYGI